MFRVQYSDYITFTMAQCDTQKQEIKGEGWKEGGREEERQGGKQASKKQQILEAKK